MTYSSFINKQFVYAIIGVSLDTEKFGYKVFSYFKNQNFKVLPINPKGGTLLDTKIYTSLDEIEEKIDVIVFVVPPKVAETVLDKVIKKGIKKVWFQPGSESLHSKIICEKNQIEFVMEECIMVENEKMNL